MKTKQLFFAASLLMLAACSSDDNQAVQPEGERIPVTLSYQMLSAVETRAAAQQGLNDQYIESGQSVHVQIANVGSTTWSPYTYTTGDDGAMTAPSGDGTPLYPTDDTNIKILAWYPADAAETNFSVQADQTTDANYQVSDLMFSNNVTNQAKQVAPVALTFVHKMAKIAVNVTSGVGVSEIRSVTLKNVHRTLSLFDHGDGNVVTKTSDEAGEVLVVKEGTEATASGAALIPDQTIDGALLEVTTDIGTATYSVDSKHFESGHKYTLNISVSRTTVNTTTAIGTWAADGSVTINSQGSPFMTFTVGGVTFRMVYVEGKDGSFSMKMGNQSSGASATYVTTNVLGLSDYYIGQTEVTNDLWVAVMGGTAPSEKNKNANFPVTNVTYTQLMGEGDGSAADCFIKKLNDLAASQLPTGMKFSLPSQIQWQWAAQGGNYSRNYTYAGSSTWGDSAWEGDNSGSTTHLVATKPANELGLYDMSGNVWEWCGDWYFVATEGQELAKDYWCPSGSIRVVRGGSWGRASAHAACLYPSFRYQWAPSNQSNDVGFRLALQ